MSKRKWPRLNGALIALFGLGFGISALAADERVLEITVSHSRGTGDDPMTVMWAENDTGDFVKTIHMFAKDKEYYKDLLAWRFKSRNKESKKQFDAVCGATVGWNKKKTIRVPVEVDGVNLLDGTHVLRIEASHWKGKKLPAKAYRYKIPLPAGYAGETHENKGHVKSVEIKIKETAK